MTRTSTTVFTFIAGALAGVVAGAFLSMDKVKKSANELLKNNSNKKVDSNNDEEYHQGI